MHVAYLVKFLNAEEWPSKKAQDDVVSGGCPESFLG